MASNVSRSNLFKYEGSGQFQAISGKDGRTLNVRIRKMLGSSRRPIRIYLRLKESIINIGKKGKKKKERIVTNVLEKDCRKSILATTLLPPGQLVPLREEVDLIATELPHPGHIAPLLKGKEDLIEEVDLIAAELPPPGHIAPLLKGKEDLIEEVDLIAAELPPPGHIAPLLKGKEDLIEEVDLIAVELPPPGHIPPRLKEVDLIEEVDLITVELPPPGHIALLLKGKEDLIEEVDLIAAELPPLGHIPPCLKEVDLTEVASWETQSRVSKEKASSIQEQPEALENLISTTMELLGIQTYPVQIGSDAGLMKFVLKGNGIVSGRLDTLTMQIQILILDLKTMLGITGLGLDLQDANMTWCGNLVLVTVKGNDAPIKVIMSVIDEQEYAELSSKEDPFYLLYFDRDLYEEEIEYTCSLTSLPQGEVPQTTSIKPLTSSGLNLGDLGEKSTNVEYRVHIVAKLLLLLRCEQPCEESFWQKAREFSMAWNWQDVEVALVECENSWRQLQSGVQFKERGGSSSKPYGSGSPYTIHSLHNNVNDKGKSNSSSTCGAEGDGLNEKDGIDVQFKEKTPSPINSSPKKVNCSIEVRPGYHTFTRHRDDRPDSVSWPKILEVRTTPIITISFQNCLDQCVTERRIHVEVTVQFDLGPSSRPSFEEVKQFAWYNDGLQFSFQSEEDNAAEVIKGSANLHEVVTKDFKATTANTHTDNSGYNTLSARIEASGGVSSSNVKGHLLAQRTGRSSVETIQQTMEGPNRLTKSGFNYSNVSYSGPKPSVGYKLFHYNNIEPHLLHNGRIRDPAALCGKVICDTTEETFEASFRPRDDKEPYYHYKFRCKRQLKGYFYKVPGEPRPSRSKLIRQRLIPQCMSGGDIIKDLDGNWTKKVCIQEFSLELQINHAMTHFQKIPKDQWLVYPEKFRDVTGPNDGRETVLLASDLLTDDGSETVSQAPNRVSTEDIFETSSLIFTEDGSESVLPESSTLTEDEGEISSLRTEHGGEIVVLASIPD